MTAYFSYGNMVRINLFKFFIQIFKSFIDKINKVHLTIKLTAEWSKTSINFLDVTVSLIEGVIELAYMLSLQTVISIYNLARAILSIVKRVYHRVGL